MHKRIFLKYYTVLVIIVAITTAVLGFTASTMIGLQSFKDKSSSMERAANKLATSVAGLPKNYHIMAGNIFGSSISAVKETINSDVIIFNERGELAVTTLDKSSYADYSDVTESDAIDTVLNGEVYRSAYSLGKSRQKTGYTVGVPVITGDNRIGGAVFITTSEFNVRSIISGTMLIFLVCGLVVSVIAFVVLFFITKHITGPIYRMSDVVNMYAKGDFTKRLDVDSSHEFAPLARAFNSMADGIDDLEQMRSGFVADVSHELRTPLTTIKGFVDGMLDGTIPPELYEKYLTTVSEEVSRVSRMVTSFLDLAKIRSGQITFTMKPFDIVATTGKSLFTFGERIEQKQIDLTADFESDSITATGDEDAIYRVIYNLVDNAIKFTDVGGKIRCKIKTDNDKVSVTVFNTGCGISKENAKHIFERFYKADKSRGENRNGTGIGLYLVKSIIKAHGEDIILTSKEGEYASFTFTLPLYRNEEK